MPILELEACISALALLDEVSATPIIK